jgi:hypothetical protein
MFIRFGINNVKSIHTLPLLSLILLSLISNLSHLKSLPLETLRLFSLVSLMTKTRMIVDNIFLGFQKSGIKSREVLHFVPLQRFYAVLFVPLFCLCERNAGHSEKTTLLHNVDNIGQKDIKVSKYGSGFGIVLMPIYNTGDEVDGI